MTREEAIDIIRDTYHTETELEALKVLLPELQESEDERIRKFLLRLAKRCVENSIDFSGDIKKKDVIDWLERQKEQKPSINIEQLKSLMLQYLQEAANEKEDSDIEADTDKWARKILGYDFEQKPVDPSDDELQRHQDELYDFKVFATKQAKEHHISFVHDFEWNNFCTELLSYFAEQKPSEWSEEDEDNLCRVIRVLEDNDSDWKELSNWLKSLRPRLFQKLK